MRKVKLCLVCKKEIEDDGSFDFILIDVCDDAMCRINRRMQIWKNVKTINQ